MSMAPRAPRKRDKLREIFGLRPRDPHPPESSQRSAGAAQPTIRDPQNPQTPSVQPTNRKVFVKGESFQTDMAVLFAAYILQESPELKRLIQLIVVIRDADSEGQFTSVLETCIRFSVQLASAPDDYRADATQAIISFHEAVAELKTIQLDGNGKNVEEWTNMINKDIDRIKPPFIDNDNIPARNAGLSKVLDSAIGPTIGLLTLVKSASSLIPVPWVQPLIGTVMNMLQAISQTRANYKDMSQIAATAGDFVVSCAVICSEATVGPLLENSLKKFNTALQGIAEECDKLHQLGLFSRYLQQSGHLANLQGIRKRLDDAIQLFQTENSINVKLDTEELHRKIDFASLHNLPSHPRYTRNEYLEKSRDDVLEYLSDWIASAQEPVLWVHGAAGLGKSTVAQELVYLLKSEDRLAGGVFLTHLTAEPPETVVQMISRQLGEMYPSAVPKIAEAARKLQGPHNSLRDYFTAYLFDPIRALDYPYQLVIVVDGLDEWRNHEAFLAELVDIPSPSPVKIVLTSRFHYSIERAVKKMPSHTYALPPASKQVIERYFHRHFNSDNIDWRARKPDDSTISQLAARADGLLVWAATARLLIMNKFSRKYPHEILDQILSSEENMVSGKGRAGDTQLQRLYRNTISTLFPSEIREELRTFLSATLVLQEALPITNFVSLSGISGPITEEIHQRLAALQTLGDPKNGLVSPAMQRFHASLVEFISTDSDDHTMKAISFTDAHDMLAKRCLEVVFVDFLQSFRGKTCVYSQLHGVELYAVKFWPLHFCSGTFAQHNDSRELDVISEQGMRRWASLFLPSIAARFQNGPDSIDDIERSALPYHIAMMIGKEDVTTLSYYIQLLKIAIQLQPPDLRARKALAFAYRKLHEQSQSTRDLEEEITAFGQVLERTPRVDTDFPTLLNELGFSLRTRFDQQGAQDDLDRAISLHREALVLTPAPHPNRSTSLNNLGLSLQTRFEQQGSLADLDEAVSMHQEALVLQPPTHPDRSASLNNLAAALEIRFRQQGSSDDLDEAVSLHREALVLRPVPHPDHSISLHNLATSLQARFEQQGSLNDLDEAISMHREALSLRPAPHPSRSMFLNDLGICLNTRFEQHGSPHDLDEAISMHREALLSRPVPHPAHAMSLNNLANSLHDRFGEQGCLNDLDEAIAMHRDALRFLPAPHPDRSASLNNLAACLQTRFEQQNSSYDLDEAISIHREALLLLPATHPNRSTSLNNLGTSLQERFELHCSLPDLEEAILIHREALVLQPEPHPERPLSLNALATCLQTRFEKQGASNDVDEAISIYREAILLSSSAPHPLRSAMLRDFANCLHSRFKQGGSGSSITDLDEAISILQEALVVSPAPHPISSQLSRRLAVVHRLRFRELHVLCDLDAAISLYQQLLDYPIEDPNRAWAQKQLDGALEERDALVGNRSNGAESIGNTEGKSV